MSDGGATKSMAIIGMEYFEFVRYDMWEIYARPEVNHWPLMPGGPWTTTLIVIAYALFTLVFGPMYMKNRKAFNIKQLIIGFDVFLVIYNTALVLIGILVTKAGLDCWFGCNTTFSSQAFTIIGLANGYAYFISKFLDLGDTIFFVLRKKHRHISFLHVFHHSVMPFVAWAGLKYVPYPMAGWALGINSLVHIFMYTYYALAAGGYRPKWKKLMTQLQMMHFITICIHGLHLILFVLPGGNCVEFPNLIAFLEMLIGAIFFGLFTHFYVLTYVIPKRQKNDQARCSGDDDVQTVQRTLTSADLESNNNNTISLQLNRIRPSRK